MDFEHEKKWYPAVTDFNMHIDAGEMVALIGESGCGKSITALSMMGLQPPNTRIMGHMYLNGENGQEDLNELTKKEWTSIRGKRISMIFQEPMTALNPLIKVGKQVRECLLTHQKGISKKEAKSLVLEQLKSVGLPDVEDLYDCYPHQLSGGQRQRVGIARALAVDPDFIVCDEPISALDVSIQAQVINLLEQLQRERGLTYLFIAHDLGLVDLMCHQVAVMYLGNVVEWLEHGRIAEHCKHPYTKALMGAVFKVDFKPGEKIEPLEGEIPSPLDLPPGCPFASRCEHCTEHCVQVKPELKEVEHGHWVACHLFD